MKDSEIPSWVSNEVGCLWCKQFMITECIEIVDNDIHVHYFCGNDDCRRFKEKGQEAEFVLVYEGYLELYEEFLTNPQEIDKLEKEFAGMQEVKM